MSQGDNVTLKDFIDRYGVALGVVFGLALVIAILPGNAEDRQVDTGLGAGEFDSFDPETGEVISDDPFAGDTDGEFDTTASGGAGGSSGGGSTSASGGGDGGTEGTNSQSGGGGGGQSAAGVEFGSGPNCNGKARQNGISGFVPPCANWTPGSPNGGATTDGVTADKITIVRYLAQLDPGTSAILQGAQLADDAETVNRNYERLFHYYNNHYETYGRQVVFVNVEASGPSETEEAMKADALKIASEIKPFAVIEGDSARPIPNILAQELARRGVPCFCTTSATSQFYNELPPIVFSELPTADEYAAQAGEFAGKRMAGKPAKHAGSPALAAQTRKFGLIYLNGARGREDPEGERIKNAYVREFGRYGVKFERTIPYLYDPGRNQQDVTSLIAQMKNAGVTTIVAAWDPLYPILITKEATNQQYFPEWMMTGTGLSDTTTAGRLYAQEQWSNAFGITPLWVTWRSVDKSAGAREYRHGNGGSQQGMGVLINIYRERIETLFKGIHMAGPNLTNETLVNGLYAYPRTGGTPGLPLKFLNRKFPTEIKDFAEAYYDINQRGADERGQNGVGMVMKADGGKRYELGEWPSTESKAFNDPSAIATSDNPPGGGDFSHEQDGHNHPNSSKCLSCS